MRLRSILGNNKVPHILAATQWAFLVLSLAFNVNLIVSVTSAVADSGFKAITFFNIWMLLFSGILCLMFFRIRKEGAAEKSIIALLILTMFFSGASISLHFVDNVIMIMKASEIIAWTFYNSVFFVSFYRILTPFLIPVLIKERQTKRG